MKEINLPGSKMKNGNKLKCHYRIYLRNEWIDKTAHLSIYIGILISTFLCYLIEHMHLFNVIIDALHYLVLSELQRFECFISSRKYINIDQYR